ncbi:MAG: hypothetical protein ACRECY_02705 [Phyllobacterium sp.]
MAEAAANWEPLTAGLRYIMIEKVVLGAISLECLRFSSEDRRPNAGTPDG